MPKRFDDAEEEKPKAITTYTIKLDDAQMEKLREWGFPATLIVAWMVAAAYTVSFLIDPTDRALAPPGGPQEIVDSGQPAS